MRERARSPPTIAACECSSESDRMPIRFSVREQVALLAGLLRWSVLGSIVGVLAGAASAAFLLALYWATETRGENPGLLWFLPVAGVGIAWIYQRFGKSVEAGNNLLLDRIREPGTGVPLRMAPLIAVTTVATHLFGGSAGREGTAVQMGGSLANLVARPFRLSAPECRILLMAGMSGGFGSVFGTPLAGTIFGLEVLAIGRIRYDALVPCLMASVVGDLTCRGLGIDHHLYHVDVAFELTFALLLMVILAGVCFGLASLAFAELTHAVGHLAKSTIKNPLIRPVVGGLAVIGLTSLLGTRDYLGLSIPLIDQSFGAGGVFLGAFALKLLFTSITLGSGFKGGEVTPLFVIGSTLGYSFASLTGQPTAVFAALGFVGVFAGAANTPLACVLMGIELFGAELAAPLLLACIVSYIVSGHRGIYLSQQIDTPKAQSLIFAEGSALRDIRTGVFEMRPFSAGTEEVAPPDAFGDRNRFMTESGSPMEAETIGRLRIFLRLGDRPSPKTWRERLDNPPTYRRLLRAAAAFDLPFGTVRHCSSGDSNEQGPPDDGPADRIAPGNGRLPISVELLGPRARLDAFCRHSADLIRGRLVVFEEIERWRFPTDDAGPTTPD